MTFLKARQRGLVLFIIALVIWVLSRAHNPRITMGSVSDEGITVIEGTRYEGGGGLIRDAVSYASILNKPVRIESIRANRPGNGGLRLEHTVAINAMATLAAAKVDGNSPYSREISFWPQAANEPSSTGQPLSSFDSTTEGAAAIFMVAVLPYIFFSNLGPGTSSSTKDAVANGVEFTIRAGTLCVKAPSFAYVHQVIIPTFRSIGIGEGNFKVRDDHQQGWHTDYVRIPGRMTFWAKPLEKPLPAFQLGRRGTVVRIRATVHGPAEVLDVFHETVRRELRGAIKPGWSSSVEVLSEAFASIVPGQYHLLLVAETEGPQAFLGYEQVYPQKEGFPDRLEKDTNKLLKHISLVCIRGLYDELAHGNAVDEHLETLLVPYQVLGDGFSSTTSERNKELVKENHELAIPFERPMSSYYLDVTTLHLKTSLWVASRMTGVEFTNRDEQFGCQGIGIGTSTYED